MSRIGKRLLFAGLGLVFAGPLAGVGITVTSMIRATHQLNENGITDPTQLAGKVGTALVATEIGLVVALAGAVLVVMGGGMVFWEGHKRLGREEAARHSTTPPPSP